MSIPQFSQHPDKAIYQQFSIALESFKNFLNSSYFLIFIMNADAKDTEIWNNIILSTGELSKSLQHGEINLEDIILYNNYSSYFYDYTLPSYLTQHTKALLLPFMLKKDNQ